MNNINWYYIFKLKEFAEYLNDEDLILLCMSSKKLRKLLIKETSNTLNLHSFTSSNGYSSHFIRKSACQYHSIY
jgi:hypothetical protein